MYHQNYISNCFKFDITLLERSSIYIKNSNGSKNEASGTPALINSQLEFGLYVELISLKFLTCILNPHGKPNPKFLINAKFWKEFPKRDSYQNICRFYTL